MIKTDQIDEDWLNMIAGKPVADAIKYLSQYDPKFELTYWQSAGDDQGVEISSAFLNNREATPEELEQDKQDRFNRKLKDAQLAVAYWKKKVDEPPIIRWVAEDKKRLAQAELKLEKILNEGRLLNYVE